MLFNNFCPVYNEVAKNGGIKKGTVVALTTSPIVDAVNASELPIIFPSFYKCFFYF